MIFLESIRIALSQLWAHKLRSFLTLLGMLIGVGSVVGIISISEGLKRMVVGEFGKIGGANLLIVMPQPWVLKEGRWVQATHFEPLTLEDVERVAAVSQRLEIVLPVLQRSVEVRHAKATYDGQLVATLPAHTRAFHWEVEEGRFLREKDLEEGRPVCVLGQEVRKELFGPQSPLGQEVKLNGQRHTVVGVMEEKKMFDQNWGTQVLVPVSAAQRRLFGSEQIDGLTVLTRAPEDPPLVIPLIEKTLKGRHGQDSEYRIETGKGILEQVEQTILVMKLVTGGIAGISLLVGGIGIMNIMLVSVAERTREIGIRKAIGAKPRVLRLQFVVEAIALSLVGGLLGIGAGVGLGLGISAVIGRYSQIPFPSAVSLNSVFLALGISTAIGLFFGIYPAVRASRLNPVDALGAE